MIEANYLNFQIITSNILTGTPYMPPAAPPVDIMGITKWSFHMNSSTSCTTPGPPGLKIRENDKPCKIIN